MVSTAAQAAAFHIMKSIDKYNNDQSSPGNEVTNGHERFEVVMV